MSASSTDLPTVEGPAGGGQGILVAGTGFDLSDQGYTQTEYFLSGTAEAYAERADGTVAPTESAPYRTRIVVYRPADPTRFNGTVAVEWLNVSGGIDAAADWMFLHRELMRRGAAYVAVSAQYLGIHGGASPVGIPANPLTTLDPDRYGELRHPGDRFSYDIYSQAGATVRAAAGTLADLAIERIIAVGESQSAHRLTTYINDIDPQVRVFDGFLVHARGGTSAPLDDDTPGLALQGDAVFFRPELRVPVMCIEAETDLITLGYHTSRQDDSDQFRLWEIAGTSHADVYTFIVAAIDSGTLPIGDLARAWRPTDSLLGFHLERPINVGPQRYVMAAAFAHLDRWVHHGTPPPSAPRLELAQDGGPQFVLDEHGNVKGGIRTPQVDVPTATLSGLGNSGAPIALLCGSTIAFDQTQLAYLYANELDYVTQFAAATDDAVRAGFVLEADAPEMKAIAAANYPGP